MPITVTFDLEDNRRSLDQEERFTRMSERFLAFLAERGIRATVFIVGEIAQTHPQLVRDVAAAGHEVALHGMRHVTLGDVGPGRLRDELTHGRALLEDVAGVPVTGFRAPIFSLTPATAWARDEILDAGFAYSSSVLPASSPLHGWPGAPRRPFRWANGLAELPCPVRGRGRASIPVLGGVYLRYLPRPVVERVAAGVAREPGAWLYCHPYDLDSDEPFFVMPHAGWLTSRILHARRAGTLARVARAVEAAGGAGPPLAEVLSAHRPENLPLVS